MYINVIVQPKKKKQGVQQLETDYYRVQLKSIPMRGEANNELINVLAEYFNTSKYKIKIVNGHSSREKLVEIMD